MKIRVTQDTLYEFLLDHDLKISRLAELIGKSTDVVFSCFKRHKDAYGHPRGFTDKNIKAINEALPVLASELNSRILTFGSEQTYTNMRNTTYDPALVGQIKELGKYFNITGLTWRVLGWNKFKKSSILSQKTSITYGCVKASDTVALNNEVINVIAVLLSYEIVADGETALSENNDESNCNYVTYNVIIED